MKTKLCTLLALTVVMVACTPLEQTARNTAAALQGAIGAAQSKYQTQCTASPNLTACTVINQAIAGQNALVTATEAYCGWSPTNPPANTTATCVPVKSAAGGLQAAVANASLVVTELKGILQ